MIAIKCPNGVPFEVFVVYTGGGERDSGNPDSRYVFTDKAAAEEKAKGIGWYGSNAHVGKHLAIKDSEGLFWLLNKQISDINMTRDAYERDIKAKALKKLTSEEKRVLGI